MINKENNVLLEKIKIVKKILELILKIYIILKPIFEETVEQHAHHKKNVKEASFLLNQITRHCEELCWSEFSNDNKLN